MLQRLAAFAGLAALIGGIVGSASAEEGIRLQFDKDQLNKGRVSIITGGLEYVHNTYMQLAGEMAAVLNEEGDLRVLPIMGGGPVDNIKDLLFLKGIDVGVVHSDVLAFLQKQKAMPSAQRKLRYIAKLYDEYFHIVAHKDVQSLQDLAGREVVVGTTSSSGSTVSALTLFETLGIKPRPLIGDWKSAVEKIKKGDVAAMVYSTVRGSKFVREIQADDTLKLLPVPYTDELSETYFEAAFTSEDYPNLVSPGRTVPTLQFAAIMAVYNWEPGTARHENVSRFVTKLFDNIEELKKPPHHSRWQAFDPAAEVRGWERFQPAQAWVNARAAEQKKQPSAAEVLQVDAASRAANFRAFAEYMRKEGGMSQASNAELAEMFRRFVDWKSGQSQ